MTEAEMNAAGCTMLKLDADGVYVHYNLHGHRLAYVRTIRYPDGGAGYRSDYLDWFTKNRESLALLEAKLTSTQHEKYTFERMMLANRIGCDGCMFDYIDIEEMEKLPLIKRMEALLKAVGLWEPSQCDALTVEPKQSASKML